MAAGRAADPPAAWGLSEAAALEALLAAAPLFAWQADATGRITWASGAGLATLGMTPQQVRDAGWLEAVEPAHRARVTAAWHAACAAGARYEVEFPVRDAARGEYRWHWVCADPVRAPGGAIERWVGLALDVHAARGALAAREHELATLADHAPAIIARFDRDGRHRFVNRAVEAATGRPVAQFLGRTNAELGMPPELCARWDAALAAVFATGCPQEVEFAFDAPAGRRLFRSVIGPERAADGRIETVVAVAQDVTELRAAQAALQASERAARAAAERVQLALAAGAIVGTWDWDLVADRFTVDERFADTFGLDPALGREGLALEQVISTVHPEDAAGLHAAIAEAIARGGPFSHEYRVRSRDGAWRWIEANGRVDLAPDGRAQRFPGVLLDRERHRQLAAERDRAAGLLAAFVEAVPGVVYAKDGDGRMLLSNAGTAALIGKAPEAFLGRTDAEFLDDPVQAAAVMANDRRVLESGVPEQVEEEVSWPDGRRAVWLSSKAPFRAPAGRGGGVIGTSIDITARRDAEERLRLAVESSSLGWWDMDVATRRVVWSERAYRMFDVPPEPAGPVSLAQALERIHPADGARVAAAIEAAMDPAGEGRYRETYRVVWRDGTLRWIEAVGRVHFEPGARRARRFVGVLWDVTEQREATERLAASEERLQLAVRSSSLGTYDLDARTLELRWSANAWRMFGYDEAAARLALDDPVSRIHPEDRERVRAAIAAAWSPAGSGEYHARYRVVWPDGTLRWIEAVGAGKFEGEGDARHAVHLAGVLWDVTEHEQLVATLREADRRKDEFLAMLAHELRNPLAPVLNAVRIIERREALGEAGARALAMIERAARHMKRLVDDLLEVSRITRGRIELQCEPMLLATTVAQVVEALLPAIEAKGQTLEVVQPPRPVRLVADAVRLTQVLENLVTNASKYTPAGGAIRIEVAEAGDEACVRVIDTGVGLAPEQLAQVFELFVQAHAHTEHAAGGLGIGLAMVKKLVELHGGRVRAESAGPGCGATFEVCLPKGGPPAAGAR